MLIQYYNARETRVYPLGDLHQQHSTFAGDGHPRLTNLGMSVGP